MEITQQSFDAMRRQFTERYFYAVADKAGGLNDLLARTKGRSRGEVEYIVDSLFPEEEPNAGLVELASRSLLDEEMLFDGLGALPWAED